jgi:tetratricopeptide (TPR) repeat protein
MKVIIGFLALLLFIDPGDIGKANTAKSKAKEAFIKGDYKTAIEKYKFLTDSLGVKEEEVLMNLAHSYFNLNDTANAIASYQKLLSSNNKQLKSNAYQQLGVLNNRQEHLEEALANFKEALKTDPTNEDARYDYEMVKKKLEEKKKQEQQDQDKKDDQNKDQQDKENKDQKEKDQQNQDKNQKEQDKKDQEQKEKEQKEKSDKEKKEQKDQKAKEEEEKEQKDQKDKKDNFNPDKLKEMKVTEEKAKMILEAMKNQEIQYLQQNKRKATKPKEKGKPDW